MIGTEAGMRGKEDQTCVDKKYLNGLCRKEYLQKYSIVPFEDIEKAYPKEKYAFFICVGYTNMNAGRERVYHRIKEKGYQILTYIHPTALVQTDHIDEGCLLFENVTIGPFCTIGLCNVFYPCSHLAHHSQVGDFNFFAISCSIAGHVIVRDSCFFGNNCTTKNGIIIANKTLLGAGAYLDRSTNEREVIVPFKSYKLENRLSTDIVF